MVNAAQIRAARSLLDIEQSELADSAGVSPRTVIRLERGEPVRADTIKAVQRELERRGVEFIAENGGGAGVRLRKRAKK